MRILFQGDSITDCGRARDNDAHVGTGYPLLVKSELGFLEPNQHEFFNRGVSGNRIVDVYARMKADILNLKPDLMSLLIGVNDVWHDFTANPNGVDADKYFKIYDMLVGELLEALPSLKLMILEPFVLPGTANADCWEVFSGEVYKRAAKAKAIAKKYDLTFIPLQEQLTALAQTAPADYWLVDGVHPTAMGHQLIKREWLRAYHAL